MTLPTNIIYPLDLSAVESNNPADTSDYIRSLVDELQRSYSLLARAINGSLKADYDVDQGSWIPELKGSTTAGTFTYTHQVGYSFRQGIMTEIWFDIAWSSAGSAAGNLILKLPYQVAMVSTSSTWPFVGVVQPSGITFTGGTDIVINAMPNTFNGEFWNIGDGFTSANQAVVGNGRLIGHIRYIGQQNERS